MSSVNGLDFAGYGRPGPKNLGPCHLCFIPVKTRKTEKGLSNVTEQPGRNGGNSKDIS